jgi:hypothetical protein
VWLGTFCFFTHFFEFYPALSEYKIRYVVQYTVYLSNCDMMRKTKRAGFEFVCPALSEYEMRYVTQHTIHFLYCDIVAKTCQTKIERAGLVLLLLNPNSYLLILAFLLPNSCSLILIPAIVPPW